MFDASDKRICQLSDTDVSGFFDEIGPQSELGPAYCAPLAVAGIRGPMLELTATERAAFNLDLDWRAHMALSFLAAVDHEIGIGLDGPGCQMPWLVSPDMQYCWHDLDQRIGVALSRLTLPRAS